MGVGAEEAGDIALNIAAGDRAAIFGQEAIVVRENGRESAARVRPFVDDLLEDAGVGMLGNEAGAQHFDAFAGDFFNDGRVVHEPPAAKGHEVVEFSSEDAKLVLIFAAENANEKTIRGKFAAKSFESDEIRAANGVSRETDAGIDLFAYANHERKWKIEFATGGENGVAQQKAIQRIAGECKCVRKRASHVDGAHALGPVCEKAADFSDGFAGGACVRGIALGGERLPVLRPSVEDSVEPKHGVKLRMRGGAVEPKRRFGGIEWVVGHDDAGETGHLEDARDVRIESLLNEECTGFCEGGSIGGQLERVKNSDDTARRFGDGRVFDEQSAPDKIGLLRFRKSPVVFGSYVG